MSPAARTHTHHAVGAALLVASLFAIDCHQRLAAPREPVTVRLDQSNLPPWTGGWTVIGRGSSVVRLAQTFTPLLPTLVAVDIDVITGNRGRGGDVITVKVVQSDRVLAMASNRVEEGFDGLLRFDFAAAGVTVTPGTVLQLQVEDTSKDVFGWRYGLNTYPGGVAYFDGTPWNDGVFDFRFRTYGY